MPLSLFQVIYLNYVALYLISVPHVHAFNEYKLTGVSAVASQGKNEERSDRFKTGSEKRNSNDFNLKSFSKLLVDSGTNGTSFRNLKNSRSSVVSIIKNSELKRNETNILPVNYRNEPKSGNSKTLGESRKSGNSFNSLVSEKETKYLKRLIRRRTLSVIDSNSSIVNISFANLEVKPEQHILPKFSFNTNLSSSSAKILTKYAAKKELNNETDSSFDQVTTQDIWTISTITTNESVGDLNSTECFNVSTCKNILGHAPSFQTHTLVKGIVLLNLGILACVGNVATLSSIIRRGRQHSSTVYLLLVHLSVSDLFVTCFCIIGEGFWTLTVEWYGGDFMCKIFKFLQMFSLYLSTFVLVVIGFDRLCAVKFPMRRIKARMQVHRAVTSAWVLSGVLSAPQAVIFRVAKGPFIEEFYQCVTYGFYTAPWQEQLYTSFSLLFMFLIPLCILITTYSTTFATIASRTRIFGGPLGPLDDARCKMLRKAKIKSLWITVVIVSTFIICWTPYYISMIISVFLDPDEQLGQNLHDVIFFFGSSTAVLNPVIYGAFHLRKRGKPASSNQSSSKFEPSFALSTMRKVRCTNGRSCHRDTRRSTQGSNVEFF